MFRRNVLKICAVLFFMICSIFVLNSVSLSANQVYGIDEYGIPIRNTKSNLPSWYLDTGDTFEPFHDETIPRVVDRAGIFPDMTEEKMKARIAEISSTIGKDIVIVTDLKDYNLGLELYSYDFYDYNGYGIGDDFEGFCLFICMDPNKRGGWTGVTGDDSRALYTEDIANDIDDILYDYLAKGEYGKGVLEWIECINNLCTKGMPLVPFWYPSLEEKKNFVWKFNENGDRVIDESGLIDFFSVIEKKELDKEIKVISEKYDIDIVILKVKNDCNMGLQKYTDDFYYYNGYGFGEDHNGIVLIIFCYDGNNERYNISAYGRTESIFTDVNYGRLIDHVRSQEDYCASAECFLKEVEHMLKTGRVPRSFGQWMFCAIVSVIVGLFVGKRFLNHAKKKMVTVKIAYGADNYITSKSDFAIGTETFVSSSVSKTKIVRSYSSGSSYRSSSSSSHRSTYHSSSRGSSGRSHSGSGRRF